MYQLRGRGRFPYEQPIKSSVSHREVRSWDALLKAIGDHKKGDIDGICVTARIAVPAGGTLSLPSLGRHLLLECRGGGVLVSGSGSAVHYLFTWLDHGAAKSGTVHLVNLRMGDELDPLQNFTSLALINGARGTLLWDGGRIPVYVGKTSSGDVLLDAGSASTGGLGSAGFVGHLSRVSCAAGDVVCDGNGGWSLSDCEVRDITLSASGDVRACKAQSVSIANGVGECIVAINRGNADAGAISATTGDGNTVIGNRGFSAYPTGGAGDVIANNA